MDVAVISRMNNFQRIDLETTAQGTKLNIQEYS